MSRPALSSLLKNLSATVLLSFHTSTGLNQNSFWRGEQKVTWSSEPPVEFVVKSPEQ